VASAGAGPTAQACGGTVVRTVGASAPWYLRVHLGRRPGRPTPGTARRWTRSQRHLLAGSHQRYQLGWSLVTVESSIKRPTPCTGNSLCMSAASSGSGSAGSGACTQVRQVCGTGSMRSWPVAFRSTSPAILGGRTRSHGLSRVIRTPLRIFCMEHHE
jgi:hypothetical protein